MRVNVKCLASVPLLMNLIPLALWYGALVLGPDFASNSQYSLSCEPLGISVCVRSGGRLRCLLSSFSALTLTLESESCLNKMGYEDSLFISRKNQC